MSVDHTIIHKSISDALKGAGCPLTDEQYCVLGGALSYHQAMIEEFGLTEWVYQFKAAREKMQEGGDGG